MNNANMPAMPVKIVSGGGTSTYRGLTKREQVCITLGVPETGDEVLDDIIRMSERKRIATVAMQSLLLSNEEFETYSQLSSYALMNADALLEELNK